MKKIINENDYIKRFFELLKEEVYINFFKETTNLPHYDELLENGNAIIKKITAEEYLEYCAKIQDTSYDKQIALLDRNNINLIKNQMKKGTKYDLPYLDFYSRNQEGRHRVMAANQLGQTKVPVLFVGDINDLNKKEIDNNSIIDNIKNVDDLFDSLCGNTDEIETEDFIKYFLNLGKINGKPFDREIFLYELYGSLCGYNKNIVDFLEYINVPKFLDLAIKNERVKNKLLPSKDQTIPISWFRNSVSKQDLDYIIKNHSWIIDTDED